MVIADHHTNECLQKCLGFWKEFTYIYERKLLHFDSHSQLVGMVPKLLALWTRKLCIEFSKKLSILICKTDCCPLQQYREQYGMNRSPCMFETIIVG